jgi:hypothetical protein
VIDLFYIFEEREMLRKHQEALSRLYIPIDSEEETKRYTLLDAIEKKLSAVDVELAEYEQEAEKRKITTTLETVTKYLFGEQTND